MPSNHETRNSYYLVRPTLRKKIWFVILLLLTAKILAAQTTSVTLSWNANSEPDVVGYRLYYGRTSHNYEQNIDRRDGQQPESAEFRQRCQVGVDILIGPDEGVDHNRRSLSIEYF